jgi:hypothetical protein
MSDTTSLDPLDLTSDATPSADVEAAGPDGLAGHSLGERIGAGGMGEVYRCGDDVLRRDLAVKILNAELRGDAAAEERFLREARLTGSLQHPGVVPVHQLGRLADGRPCFTMKLVRGHTFAEMLRDEPAGPERLPRPLAVLEKVSQAVAFAHSKGVIHRDLKPANVMVGEFVEVQVMDWGLAKELRSDEAGKPVESAEDGKTVARVEENGGLSRAGAALGTPAYMPPEQAAGDWDIVDERADVFALGAILCEVLTGQPPYFGGGRDDLLRRARRGDLTQALSRLESCGADALLVHLCRECLAPEREGRPRNAAVVAERLAAYQAEVRERLRRAELERARAEVEARERRKRRWLAVALALAALLREALDLVRLRLRWLVVALAALLLLSLGAAVWWQRQRRPAEADGAALVDPDPFLAIRFHDGPKEADDRMPIPTMRFGLVMLREKDPAHPERLKKLTFDEWGRTNNTCLRVDGSDFLFGQPPGVWLEMKGALKGERAGRPRDGLFSSWRLPDPHLEVTQEVEIIPGEQSRRLDTCLVLYTLENKDTRPHQVGIRFMLDTYIGANDGVPFTIPGATGLCDTSMKFDRPNNVPDFIQALEKDDLRNPGTVAYLQFRIGSQVESPTRVTLGGWPNQELQQFGPQYHNALSQLTRWDVPFISMKELDRLARGIGRRADRDSAVTMYWNERELAPGKDRVVGFTYGLGSVDTSESEGHLLLTVGGQLVRKGEFTLTALVHNPQPGERLTLILPSGFHLLEGHAEQEVPEVPAAAERTDSPVTWRIRAGDDGRYELVVRSNRGARETKHVSIRPSGFFD